MRRIIAALVISAVFILSGVSVTTCATGQFIYSAWADGAGD
jgi:hypothetical protein